MHHADLAGRAAKADKAQLEPVKKRLAEGDMFWPGASIFYGGGHRAVVSWRCRGADSVVGI